MPGAGAVHHIRTGLASNRASLRDEANAAAGDKLGAFSFARRRCLVATGGRTGDAGIPRGEDQSGRHGGHRRAL